MPSPVVARVKELLPDVEERVWPVEPNAAVPAGLEFVTNPRRTMSCLAVLLRQAKAGRPIDPLWWDVYSWFARGGGGTVYPGAIRPFSQQPGGQAAGRFKQGAVRTDIKDQRLRNRKIPRLPLCPLPVPRAKAPGKGCI